MADAVLHILTRAVPWPDDIPLLTEEEMCLYCDGDPTRWSYISSWMGSTQQVWSLLAHIAKSADRIRYWHANPHWIASLSLWMLRYPVPTFMVQAAVHSGMLSIAKEARLLPRDTQGTVRYYDSSSEARVSMRLSRIVEIRHGTMEDMVGILPGVPAGILAELYLYRPILVVSADGAPRRILPSYPMEEMTFSVRLLHLATLLHVAWQLGDAGVVAEDVRTLNEAVRELRPQMGDAPRRIYYVWKYISESSNWLDKAYPTEPRYRQVSAWIYDLLERVRANQVLPWYSFYLEEEVERKEEVEEEVARDGVQLSDHTSDSPTSSTPLSVSSPSPTSTPSISA